ncbi:MAG TPA: hypothetical protein DCK99_08530 [Blastocatellia bacterium]|nr:hypothetical protein [Blastocatellia bacterium]
MKFLIPFTVALLLDVSGSTQSQLQAIRTAANAFIKLIDYPQGHDVLISALLCVSALSFSRLGFIAVTQRGFQPQPKVALFK